MKKLYFLTTVLLNCTLCDAQNLVPNPGFEIYSSCPSSFGEVVNAVPWFQPTTGTSDYYDSCAFGGVDVPSNYLGFQYARHGNGYAGFFTFYYGVPQWNYKEYIEVPLTSPLTAGVTYYVNFFVSLSDSTNYATDDIGAYFSVGSVTSANYNPLPYVPQVSNPSNNIISDKLNWTMISGSYIASGGETHLTIGTFVDDNNIDTVYTGGGTLANIDYVSSYYYIDDVCVSADSTNCLGPVGIEEWGPDQNDVLFPNPFENEINIHIKINDLSEFILYDMASRKLLQQTFTNTVTINTGQLAKGIYFYEIRPVPNSSGNKNGVIKKGKVVKE